MASAKPRRLSTILHSKRSSKQSQLEALQDEESILAQLAPDAVLSVEDQVRIMEARKHFPHCREDVRFAQVWVKGDGSVVAVRDMSRDHMCSSIGLWLRKEFEEQEAEQLGLTPPSNGNIKKVSPYDGMETWLTVSESVQTTPSLRTMLARLSSTEPAMQGGMQRLETVLASCAQKSLATVHSTAGPNALFKQPAFF